MCDRRTGRRKGQAAAGGDFLMKQHTLCGRRRARCDRAVGGSPSAWTGCSSRPAPKKATKRKHPPRPIKSQLRKVDPAPAGMVRSRPRTAGTSRRGWSVRYRDAQGADAVDPEPAGIGPVHLRGLRARRLAGQRGWGPSAAFRWITVMSRTAATASGTPAAASPRRSSSASPPSPRSLNQSDRRLGTVLS